MTPSSSSSRATSRCARRRSASANDVAALRPARPSPRTVPSGAGELVEHRRRSRTCPAGPGGREVATRAPSSATPAPRDPPPQVERQRVVVAAAARQARSASRASTSITPVVWPTRLEPAGPAGLGLLGVDRRVVVRAAARVDHVVGGAAAATAGCRGRPRRRPAASRPPASGAAPTTASRPCSARRRRSVPGGAPVGAQRHRRAVAGHSVPARVEAGDRDLEPLDRGVDVAGGAAGGWTPRRARATARSPVRSSRSTSADLGSIAEPAGTGTPGTGRTRPGRTSMPWRRAGRPRPRPGRPPRMRQQEPVVQPGAPADQRGAVRRSAQTGPRSGADQQRLHQRHVRVRRHLEAAQLQQARAGRGASPGLYSLSMQNSARWVLPVMSVSRCRSARSTAQGRWSQLVVLGRSTAARSRRRRSPARTGSPGGPRRPAAPGWSGRRTDPRTGTTATGGAASR